MLTDVQLSAFATQGYLVVPGVFSEEELASVDAEFDRALVEEPPPENTVAQHFYFWNPDRLPAADIAIRDSGALKIAEELVAPHHLDHAFDHIQLALNIPPNPHIPGAPHIDGHVGELSEPESFTMLAGIFLTDESVPDSGNLWVWPGSHLLHERVFREHGTDALLASGGYVSEVIPLEDVGTGVPLLANRGDLLLAHYLLGHNIGGNTSAHTRRAVYYRLACEGHRERGSKTLTDAFTEYEPLRKYAP